MRPLARAAAGWAALLPALLRGLRVSECRAESGRASYWPEPGSDACHVPSGPSAGISSTSPTAREVRKRRAGRRTLGSLPDDRGRPATSPGQRARSVSLCRTAPAVPGSPVPSPASGSEPDRNRQLWETCTQVEKPAGQDHCFRSQRLHRAHSFVSFLENTCPDCLMHPTPTSRLGIRRCHGTALSLRK